MCLGKKNAYILAITTQQSDKQTSNFILLYSNYSAENIKWSSTFTSVNLEPFSQPTGPHIDIPTVVKEIFFLFFTSSILDHIVVQSNKYASECMGEKFSTWKQIIVEELLAYIGCMVLMGIVQLPATKEYWKQNETYHYTPVASRISRNHFYELHRYLHFADNSTLSPPVIPTYNKLGKICPILKMITESFL